MGCFASSEAAGAYAVASEKGSLAVIEDPELAAAERVLHQNLEMEAGVVLARRDTAVVNLQCIGSGHQPAEMRLASPHSDGAQQLFSQVSLRTAVPLAHGFARLSSMRVNEPTLAGVPNQPRLFAAQSMPAGMRDERGTVMSASRAALQTLISNEQRPFLADAQPNQAGCAPAAQGGAGTEHGSGGQTNVAGGHASNGQPADVKPPLSQSARLKERLERLRLLEVTMQGDGNCQFRSLSYQLFGTQDHHASVRRNVIRHIQAHKEEFSAFLGEEFALYVEAMSRNGTWGDELTLRAACDRFGARICLVTSEESNWFIQYEPRRLSSKRELFLAYISPIHYNALRRSDALRQMMRNISNRFSNPSTKAKQKEQQEEQQAAEQLGIPTPPCSPPSRQVADSENSVLQPVGSDKEPAAGQTGGTETLLAAAETPPIAPTS